MGGRADQPQPLDRAVIERTVQGLVLDMVERGAPTGVSIVVEGVPGIGKTFLAQKVAGSVRPGTAKIVSVAGEHGRRNDPFAGAAPLLKDLRGDGDLIEAAFDRVDELCADGPVVLCADDAHNLDGTTLTLLRRLVWASRDLPLAILINTRPYPSREPLTQLIAQAQVRFWLSPMGPMTVDRLTCERTGRWPGPRLARVLALAAGNPLFVTELLRAYQRAGALAETGPDTVEARFELDLRGSGLDEMIRAHLAQLDEPTRDVLAALAVWGADIGADDLASLLPAWAEGADEPLVRAISSGLVRRDPAGTIGFSHDLFRDVTYGELAEDQRHGLHRRAAEVLAAGGYRPSLVADHLLKSAGTDRDAAVMAALHEAVEATRAHAPEITAGLLEDVAAIGAGIPDQLLLDHALALFHRGHGQSAETLIRQRMSTVTDLGVAVQLQATLISSLFNRADVPAALEVMDSTIAIPGLPSPTVRRLRANRASLLALAGRPLPDAELEAMLAGYVAAGDTDAQATQLATLAIGAFLAGHPHRALELWRERDKLGPTAGHLQGASWAMMMPATFELAASGPPAARTALARARRLAAERSAPWLEPVLGFTAGIIAFVAGDWDDAAAELDSAFEQAEETGTGWISQPTGVRAYIDAHRGHTGLARIRLESFRHRGLPLHFGHDRPGWAELAVLEAEGALRPASTLARTVWAGAQTNPGRWLADVVPDVTRIALAAMDRRLAGQIGDEVAALCPPDTARLIQGMLTADPDAIEEAAAELGRAGRGSAEAAAREELACAAAAAGDKERAVVALEVALASYQDMGAITDRDRALARARALGIRRSSREAHREVRSGWEALTATEIRIATLVREGLTNREIGTRLFVSPRTVQTHVSHILQKTGLRSRVDIARFTEA
ncbi:MAG TPA: LuxR C-terminal-related transcriptional regulator [Streptosporangiaceae bacterium]|nr:LuxR C-terminal-related transcriptional regulator [Streptosporangiaceae bacterium]